MSVFNVPELSQQLHVDDAGDVSIPLIGSVHVANDTLREAEQKITSALLQQQMLTNPHVSLEITAFSQQPVLVAGEVQQPGNIQILAPRPVLDVIATAGGVTTAAGGEIEIRHPQATGPDLVRHIPFTNGRDPAEAREAVVSPGDTVYVRRAGVIYVLGAVNHPGGYLMVNGGALTLTQAVALAGGASPIAATTTAVVVRPQGGSVQKIQVPLKEAERGGDPPYPLQNGDMVFIPTSKLKAALINSSAVLSSAASAVIYTTVK
jgi:polysaccharide export outer membrane protein